MPLQNLHLLSPLVPLKKKAPGFSLGPTAPPSNGMAHGFPTEAPCLAPGGAGEPLHLPVPVTRTPYSRRLFITALYSGQTPSWVILAKEMGLQHSPACFHTSGEGAGLPPQEPVGEAGRCLFASRSCTQCSQLASLGSPSHACGESQPRPGQGDPACPLPVAMGGPCTWEQEPARQTSIRPEMRGMEHPQYSILESAIGF